MVWPKPVKGGISSPYGWRTINGKTSFHNGQDYYWLSADPVESKKIYAPMQAKVAVGYNTAVGNYVLLYPSSSVTIRLMHMSSVAVQSGQTVQPGALLGVMGDTGTSADPGQVHLHLDVYLNGTRVDPAPYFSDTFVGTTPAGGSTTPFYKETDMFIVHHVNGSNQAKYLFTGFSLTVASSGEKEVLPTVRVDGPTGMDRYTDLIAQNVAAITGAIQVTSGGFTDADRTALSNTATSAQLDTSMSATVDTINAHTDEAVSGIHVGGSATLDITLTGADADQVGSAITLTGTGVPQG